eukprot:NODE_777_length_1876_cov_35.215552_g724_i0.p1 GENE.NODE_777_length_1876_cov_35.215552_g724_i0~~NODE_777_length_1876_cov_35.215552_g724_i0.p1  ORF type:complete len:466 (+),score=126.69 NODE_777_length_1876_cov_35.215552_g724_i0:409-1806(+)
MVWVLLLTVFIQRDFLFVAVLLLEGVLILMCFINVVSGINYFTKKDTEAFVWARALGQFDPRMEPKSRHFRTMLFRFLQCLVVVAALHILVPTALVQLPRMMKGLRNINAVLCPINLLLLSLHFEKALGVLLALDVLVILVPTSFELIHAVLHLLPFVVMIGTFLRPFHYRCKMALTCHYLIILLSRLQMVLDNANVHSRNDYIQQLGELFLVSLIITLPLYCLIHLRRPKYSLVVLVVYMLMALGWTSFRINKMFHKSTLFTDLPDQHSIESDWSMYSEQCGLQTQMATSMAQVQYNCREAYLGKRLKLRGKVLLIEYIRTSNDPLKMLPNPFHAWAMSAVRALLGPNALDKMVFQMHLDVMGDEDADLLVTASMAFFDVFVKWGCVQHNHMVGVDVEVQDVGRMLEARLFGLSGWHKQEVDTLMNLATWSMLPVYVPRNATLIVEPKTGEEACRGLEEWRANN